MFERIKKFFTDDFLATEEPLLYGTKVLITRGVFKGMTATVKNKDILFDQYLLSIDTNGDYRQIDWIDRSDFDVQEKD